MSKTALVAFKSASLGYKRVAVLAGVDLEIEEGSFWGILGHNGSGKTTILKTMLGLIPPIKGKVDMRGSGRLRFGYVPQKETLDVSFPLTAFDVALMASSNGDRPLVKRSLEECGAWALANKPYASLSGGQKQRVLIARALAAQPNLLALDEPLAGIDAVTSRSLLDLLKRLKQERPMTILMVSHRIRAEKSLFSHIAWVDEGRVTAGPAPAMLSGGLLGDAFSSEL